MRFFMRFFMSLPSSHGCRLQFLPGSATAGKKLSACPALTAVSHGNFTSLRRMLCATPRWGDDGRCRKWMKHDGNMLET